VCVTTDQDLFPKKKRTSQLEEMTEVLASTLLELTARVAKLETKAVAELVEPEEYIIAVIPTVWENRYNSAGVKVSLTTDWHMNLKGMGLDFDIRFFSRAVRIRATPSSMYTLCGFNDNERFIYCDVDAVSATFKMFPCGDFPDPEQSNVFLGVEMKDTAGSNVHFFVKGMPYENNGMSVSFIGRPPAHVIKTGNAINGEFISKQGE